MVENHTRDLLQMKAKETALARSRNDVELSQAALLKAQREVEALRTQGQGDAVREVEMWKHRTERAEQRILEREELDQGVMTRLSDLEEFIRGLDDEADGGTAQRLSGRCKLLEEQNRRLLTQMDEYSGRINTLEEVPPPPNVTSNYRESSDEQHPPSETGTRTPPAHPPPSARKTKKKTRTLRGSMLPYLARHALSRPWIRRPVGFSRGEVRRK
jgi:hypothetical protein